MPDLQQILDMLYKADSYWLDGPPLSELWPTAISPSIVGTFYSGMHFEKALGDWFSIQGPFVRVGLRQADDCRMGRICIELSLGFQRVADDAQRVQLFGHLAPDHADVHFGKRSS
ncbi:MAG: hypothetical protein OXC26_09845 [Albidovulum sp.]|nr:hypothetical protein [Albidovulum sp.]